MELTRHSGSKPDTIQRLPAVADVARRAPEVSTNLRAPLPHLVAAVLAQAVDDWAPGLQQRVTHLLVDRLHVLVFVDVAGAAPVILQVVEAPRRILLRVLLLVSEAAFVAGAGLGTRPRVDADLQPLRVH